MSILRLCEGQKRRVDLTSWQREAISQAAQNWKETTSLRQPPLRFSGAKGEWIEAAWNIAGVVEAGDVTIEIYPKLDAALLAGSTPDAARAETVLDSVLWMMEVGAHENVFETDAAALQEKPTSFFDLWARLLAFRLLCELESGVPRRYLSHEDDLTGVRGRIQIAAQVSRNWNRMDRIACAWDEFSPDTPIMRVFKCACRFLLSRVASFHTRANLENCLELLDDVADTDALSALRESEHARWDRNLERFRRAFELARRLLQSEAHSLQAGGANTFVFLVSMEKVFEDYVRAILEAHYNVGIEAQKHVGYLLKKNRIAQKADYFWKTPGAIWIGDAKYKHLAKGQSGALRFEDLEENSQSVGRLLSPDDVRQLTTYAGLARAALDDEIRLMLLYPFVGQNPQRAVTRAWNGDEFSLVPVSLQRQKNIAECIPSEAGVLQA